MVNVAILGFGVVGSGVAEVLTQNKKIIESRLATEVNIKYILDLRDFPESPFGKLVVHDFNIILNDPEVSVVAEMMGGSHPAYDFSKACLEVGKSVVTSNKEVVANFGSELIGIAQKHNVFYLFEASVGGGIPIIRPMCCDLSSNNIGEINGILNGTTNYILTQMTQNGTGFGDALHNAQKNGYAEKDPSADINGLDAARKIVILAALAFGRALSPNDIHTEGITDISVEDVELAESFGYMIKLIGHAEKLNGKILAMVSPRLIPMSEPLASINGVFNGILLEGDMVGQVMFYGPGAGKLPTASAVCADIVDVISHMDGGMKLPQFNVADNEDKANFDEYSCQRMFIFTCGDDCIPNSKSFERLFGNTSQFQYNAKNGKVALITEKMAEKKAAELSSTLTDCKAYRLL